MTFIHHRPEFSAVLRAAAAASPLKNEALVEKDYWVTHALWALSQTGVALWFKGGTSLSKAFRITNRFSEDLDLVLRPGTITGLPPVTSWRSSSATATRSRQAYWDALVERLPIPDVRINYPPGSKTTKHQLSDGGLIQLSARHHLNCPSSAKSIVVAPKILSSRQKFCLSRN